MKKRRWIAGLLCAVCISTSTTVANVQAEITSYTSTSQEFVYQKYSYSYTEDGKGISIDAYNGSEEQVEVPAYIEGKRVIKIGNDAFSDAKNLKTVKISAGVKELGDRVFYGSKKLKTIQIPKSLEKIGELAFEDTKWLQKKRKKNPLVIVNNIVIDGRRCKGKVTIPKGVKEIAANAFMIRNYNSWEEAWETLPNKKLTGISIPEGVTKINDYAFGNCINLKKIKLPSTLTYIGKSAFYNSGVKDINIPESVTDIGQDAFEKTPAIEKKREENALLTLGNIVVDGTQCTGDVVIPEGVTRIADEAFSTSNITSIELPNSLKEIGEGAFCACWELQTVKIKSATCIGAKAFYGCRVLTSVELPANIKEIQDEAFYLCNSLKEIKIPEGIQVVGNQAFGLCRVLENVSFPSTMFSIKEGAFRDIFCATNWLDNKEKEGPLLIIGNTVVDGTKCEGNVTIPEGVTTIGEGAFRGSKITGVKIPGSVSRIGEEAFSGCEGLKTVTLPKGITYIPTGTFEYCTSLQEVVVSDHVVAIGDRAFYHCDNLQKVVFPDGLHCIEKDAFAECKQLKSIQLPSEIWELEDGAFKNCSNLEEVSSPSTEFTAHKNAFMGTKWLGNK